MVVKSRDGQMLCLSQSRNWNSVLPHFGKMNEAGQGAVVINIQISKIKALEVDVCICAVCTPFRHESRQ